MQLNGDKCKVMVIDFKQKKHVFNSLKVDGKELRTVDSAKVLGLTLSSGLKWNKHITESIKKVNKRLYFLILLRRAGVQSEDVINFYCVTIRPVLEYCAHVFHNSLPRYLREDIERVQKRAISIICPCLPYRDCLARFVLSTLHDRQQELCSKIFNSISSSLNSLHSLLPPKHEAKHNTRRKRIYNLSHMCRDSYKCSFIPVMCIRANNALEKK